MIACGPVKAVIPVPPWREESSGRLDSLEPSNSRPDGLVQSAGAIVAAWIPAFAGMTALQMTPVPGATSGRISFGLRCIIMSISTTGYSMFEKLHDLGSRVRHTPVLERQRWLWDTVEPAWQRMFARISDQQGFATHINGDIFKLTYEWGSRYDRLDQRAYEPVVYAALTEAIREGMTVFDIGAHIGMFTLGTAKRVGSKGRVYAFEPSPETALILERHVALNAWQDRVEVVRAVAPISTARSRST